MAITINAFATDSGHDSKIFFDDNPEERRKIYQQVLELLKMGASLFLEQPGNRAARIKGYDPEKNEWIVGRARKMADRVPATNTTVSAVAPIAGG